MKTEGVISMKEQYAYVGCRTSVKRNARGKGIKVYKIEGQSGDWKQVQLVDGLENPSFLAKDRTGKYLYSVHGDGKIISAFKIDETTGCLHFLNRTATGFDFCNPGLDPSRGYNPVHLEMDPANKYILVANHATGNITVHPRHDDGTVEPYISVTHVDGNPTEAEEAVSFSRPHQICFDATGRYILVPAQGRQQGNGMDQVLVYAFDSGDGSIRKVLHVATRLRSWPRHIVLHPDNRFAYVINEWDNTVTAFSFGADSGLLKPLQVVPSLPETYTGDGQAAEILMHPTGKYLYASNRIHDSIVAYEVDAQTGFLRVIDWTNCEGQTPRFMKMDADGKYLYVANEDSDDIAEFCLEPASGKLQFTGRKIATESPVCIVFS